MVTISLDGYAVVLGLFLMGVINGLASAVGNILAQKYFKPHIEGKREAVNNDK